MYLYQPGLVYLHHHLLHKIESKSMHVLSSGIHFDMTRLYVIVKWQQNCVSCFFFSDSVFFSWKVFYLKHYHSTRRREQFFQVSISSVFSPCSQGWCLWTLSWSTIFMRQHGWISSKFHSLGYVFLTVFLFTWGFFCSIFVYMIRCNLEKVADWC